MDCWIQELKSVEDIEAVREHWTKLQWHPNSDMCSYHLMLKSTAGLVRPHALVVWRDGKAQAILAGRIEDTRLSVRVGYLTVPGPKVRRLTFIYGGLLGSPSSSECDLLLSALMDSLRTGQADVAFFNHLRTDSPLYAAIIKSQGIYCRDHCLSGQNHRYMTLPESTEAFGKRFSRKVRGRLRWQANKLVNAHQGQVRIQCYSRSTEVETMVRDVESVAALTYQRGLGAGFGNSPDEISRTRLKAERGWLRTYVLYVAETPVAFWSGAVYRKTFHSEFMGYDPAYRQFSPGTYLVMQVIDSLCQQTGHREIDGIDFGLGDAEYKRLLSDREWQDASPYIFAPNIRGLGLNAYRTPLMYADRLGRKMLGGRAEGRIKRLWRTRVMGREPVAAQSTDVKRLS